MTGFASETITVNVTSHTRGVNAQPVSIENGTKLKDFFAAQEGCNALAKNYSILVNGRSNQPAGYVLQAGDRISFSPTNVKGA